MMARPFRQVADEFVDFRFRADVDATCGLVEMRTLGLVRPSVRK